MRLISSFLLLLFLVSLARSQEARKPHTSPPVRIGTSAAIQGGIRVAATDIRRMLQSAPAQVPRGSGELSDDSVQPHLQRPAVREPISINRSPTGPDPISPLPSINWQATTGNPPSAAYNLTPPDPQIAVSSTHVVVGMNGGMFFYKKDGTPYPLGNNFACLINCTKNFFQPIIDNGNLSAAGNGKIDSFSDLRVIFDHYRMRFWAIATGACRSLATDPNTGKSVKCAFTLPPRQRRSVIGLAVSASEDPAGGWYFYWWDAAVGWGTNNPPYHPGDLADYPSIGINETSVDVTVKITDATTTSPATREYSHISLWDATAMTEGKPFASIANWHLYPLPGISLVCDSAGLQNPNGSCPEAIIQPTVAHGDAHASYFVSFDTEWTLVIWKVVNQFQPTVQSTEVPMSPLMRDPSDAPQKGSTATIVMSNLFHSPLKAVWSGGTLYIVTNDADPTGRAIFRALRLPTSAWPYVPSPQDVGSGGDQVRGGSTSTSSFGWPAIEVAPNGDAVVVYTRTGPSSYADIRYNVWPHDQKDMLGGRILKYGEAATPTSTRWGDLAGASVEFENGKETAAIWIAHEYARSIGGATTNAAYGVWVGKIPVVEAAPTKYPCPSSDVLLQHATCKHEGQFCPTTKKVKCVDPELKHSEFITVLAACVNGHWELEDSCP